MGNKGLSQEEVENMENRGQNPDGTSRMQETNGGIRMRKFHGTRRKAAGNSNVDAGKITLPLLLFRVCVLIFSILLILKTDGFFQDGKDLLLCFGVYQVLVFCMFRPMIGIGPARLLFCGADFLMTLTLLFLTGGITSPLIPCIFLPLFTFHVLYGIRGMISGLAGCVLCIGAMSRLPSAFFLLTVNAGRMNETMSLTVLGISTLLFYVLPSILWGQYFYRANRLRILKKRNADLGDMNRKLMALYEMVGKFHVDADMEEVMNRLLVLCNQLFWVERSCIFLIRNEEVETYGKPSPEEKQNIYQLIREYKKGNSPGGEKEYILQEHSLAVPLIRGPRINGVLSLSGWNRTEITGEEVILFSMIANLLCTYLENMEYMASLHSKRTSETSVLLNQLDSGKPVRGIVDKRILSV